MPFVAYKITHRESGKVYIGITTQKRPLTRWRHHVNVGRRGIGMAIKKYGEGAFSFEIVASSWSEEALLALETVLILQQGSIAPGGYNLNIGGKGTLSASVETRKLIGEANSRRIWSEESRAKTAARLLGHKRSAESVRKQAAAIMGRPVSDASKLIIATKAKERCKDPEYVKRLCAHNYGRRLSAESRAKIASSLRARSPQQQLELA